MINKNSKKRFNFIFIIFFLILSLISGKLIYSSIFLYDFFSSLADEVHYRSFPLYPSRGIIYDCKNRPLTYNESTLSLYIIPRQVENISFLTSNLSRILEIEEEYILNRINKNQSIVDLYKFGKHLDDEKIKVINDLKLKGVYLIRDNKRTYPYKESLAPLLGFVNYDNDALAGLEYHYEKYLKGKKGYLNYLVDAKGGIFSSNEKKIIPPVDGMNLYLSLNLDLQNILYRHLYNAYVKYDAEEVMGLMLNPHDASVLAIVNLPSYDNNNYQKYDESLYNHLLPLYNSFEPGSTFKAITFASAINEGLIDIYNDTYYDKGYEIVENQKIKSWKKGGHGLQTYLQVLENSSNPGFVNIARLLGKDKLYDYLNKFGFGKKTGIDIAGENKGIIFKYENFNLLEQATTAFGQGISVTAIQLLRAFSSLINGGYLYQPTILKRIVNPLNNETIYENKPKLIRQVIDSNTSKLMQIALESVVSNGSGAS